MLKKDLDEQGKILNARNEGIREGIHEAKLEMARAMLARGIDRATVLAISGLQPADLNEL
ncbi:MAG: hypothetical protein HC893_13515 [Chloroflexaceae bacterium]|nr:hypothetical protein [Chloroflexaceae bacterium]